MTAAVASAEVLPRARCRALLEAAAVLWLPALVPLLTGMLRDDSHVFWTYVAMLPVVPGTIVAALLQAQGAWFVVAAAVPTLLLGVVLYAVGREAPRWLLVGCHGLVAALLVAEAVGLAYALRA